MKPVILLLGILMGTHSGAFAKSYDTNCFQMHIKESIEINTGRKKDYAALTNGESNRIFTHLIALEHLTLPVAFYFDHKAKPFKKKGMELFCHEFVSMNRVTEFSPDKKIVPKYEFPKLNFDKYKKDIKAALKQKDVKAIKRISLEQIRLLEEYPQNYCMTRHLVESIYRFAYFVKIRELEAAELKINSPKQLLLDVIGSHLMALHDSVKIDIWSQPIQAVGIPILCSELPNVIIDLDLDEE